ncbi:MAG: hypothetical protein SVQ76_01130 [Candidatus Nanohaloarchaea archaeon]|nr:hypothetical protein [Candidatus Nanohaloarchaea archaeon]
MGFYDSVKDDVRRENGETVQDEKEEGEEEDKMGFDQLKESANENPDPEEEENQSSDTEIEVLGEGEVPENSRSREEERSQQSGSQDRSGRGDGTESREHSGSGETQEEILSALERIEEQNSEMLDVLRGIKRSLDR